MAQQLFGDDARWVWSEQADRPYNNYVAFRRVIDVEGPVARGLLRVTADSRYEVWVNGRWLGHGPARSWLSPWPVDEYDLRGWLKEGRNVVAVLVQHYGIGTFQYIHADPGLLAQVEWEDGRGAHALVTDGAWRAVVHDGYASRVPRISVQQGWEEQFDAGGAASGIGLAWRDADFDDSAWPAAVVMRRAGEPPHERFEIRDIPMLSRDVVEPVRVQTIEAVRTARHSLGVNLRDFLDPADKTANMLYGRFLLQTFIRSDRAQAVEFHQPGWSMPAKLNGKELKFDDHALQPTNAGVARARLKAGWNTLLVQLKPGHALCTSWNVWTGEPVTFSSSPREEAWGEPWVAIG
ncbi:MAG: family 78 glycoside hydrolase catalytic domain, partial [Tepidisphaeraceae bacterium]